MNYLRSRSKVNAGIYLLSVFSVITSSNRQLSPRSFVESLHGRGTYTVMPIAQGMYGLDLSFHLQRLRDGVHAIIGPCENDTLDTAVISSIRSAVTTLTPSSTFGIATVAAYIDKTSEMKFQTLYTEMDQNIYTSAISPVDINIDIHEYRRSDPQIKDIAWPEKRKVIEAKRKQPVVDSIMSRQGVLSEGLISNFYVVDSQGKITTCSENVLRGSMAHILHDIAAEDGITIDERPPLLTEMSTWRAAFLVSSCKPIHFIGKIFSQDGTLLREFNAPDWETIQQVVSIKKRLADIFKQYDPLKIQSRGEHNIKQWWSSIL